MNRINIYTECSYGMKFEGWFNRDSAVKITEYCADYNNGYAVRIVLYATSKGKLIINRWDQTGYSVYRFARDENEIAEILSAGRYAGDDKKLTEILSKYEI